MAGAERWRDVRRGEALGLRWQDIDWENKRHANPSITMNIYAHVM